MVVDLKGKKVLIIEDDTLLHSLLAEKMTELRNQGVEVLPALSADEGLAALPTFSPDLVLLDIVMPGKNGFEFLEEFRKNPRFKDTPVIVLSNLNQETERTHAKQLGVVRYLIKADFSLGEISQEVLKALSGAAS